MLVDKNSRINSKIKGPQIRLTGGEDRLNVNRPAKNTLVLIKVLRI